MSTPTVVGTAANGASEGKCQYTVAELFCGCGGLSHGFTKSGHFRVVLGNDIKKAALRTFAHNHSRKQTPPEILEGDIRTILTHQIEEALKRQRVAPRELDCLIGGPPCQGFSQMRRSEERLEDGCYIVSGEVPKEKMAASQVVASCKKLGLVEEAFRSLKTVQLEVRPVYHKTDDRIRSHVFLCTLAYYLQWHLKQRLEPLFAADGTNKDRQWTVRNVIERLAAIRREKIAMGTVEFEKVTTPEPDQQTILDYLKVRL